MVSLFAVPVSAGVLADAVNATLHDAREAMHRSGRLSTRNEAVEEMSKLLFTHLTSVRSDGIGITSALLGDKAAEKLAVFVRQTYDHHLPPTLHSELSVDDFCLRLKQSENHFASELVEAFGPLCQPEIIRRMKLGDAGDILNDTFSQFLANSFVDEKELGQYLTPTEIVRMMVRLGFESLPSQIKALLTDDHSLETPLVLDASCGAGSFLAEAVRWISEDQQHGLNRDRIIAHLLRSSIFGIDKSERMLKLALSSLSMLGAPPSNLHLANSLRRTGADGNLTNGLYGRAALILTNPPFGASFSGDDLLNYKLATQWTPRPPASLDSELLFMERYSDWLMPGGVLVTIVPDSILTNRGSFKNLREGLLSSLEVLSVISLPAQTFAAAGTSTKTSILHARKIIPGTARSKTYFGICEHIGFRVVTRKSQRVKVREQQNDLPKIFQQALETVHDPNSTEQSISLIHERWDAASHLCQPQLAAGSFGLREGMVPVKDIASLVNEPFSARGHDSDEFRYIEIGDIDGATLAVSAKTISSADAPGRAKKRVRAGDILVSTVRPDRRSVGVVPQYLDGAVCSNGIAVLRPNDVDPYVLAVLLRSDLVVSQMMGANIGIAYPSFDEEILPGVLLPVERSQMSSQLPNALRLHTLTDEVYELRRSIMGAVEEMIKQRLQA